MNIASGLDALNMLNNDGEGAKHENKFTPFKAGESKTVKILSTQDVVAAYTYSIYRKVPTFVPEEMPKLSKKGYPVENLTPWDKASQYHYDLSEAQRDHHSQEGYKYAIKPRYAFGFYDLDEEELIIIDFSKKQAKSLHEAIMRQEKKIGKKAFTLEKTNPAVKSDTQVILTPEDLEDLTDKQQEAFDKAPEEFDKEMFEDLFYVQDEQQMVESLHSVGFDVTKIGFEAPTSEEAQPAQTAEVNEEDPTENF